MFGRVLDTLTFCCPDDYISFPIRTFHPVKSLFSRQMFVSLQVHFHKTAIHLFSVVVFAFVCFAFLEKYYLP